MSGITGIYYLDGRQADRHNVERMLNTLAHRGPDDAGIWVEGSVGLGHKMLWTTPESLFEKLPYVNSGKNFIITSDSRIDNREELIPRLQFHNCPPKKISDSQLILAAYEKWGEECPQHLLGDFAFAIWDAKEQKLFCARDHMGIKPFYYFQKGNVFAFGSEIKALLCLSEVPRKLNEGKVGEFLSSLIQDKVNTFYQDIFRLPPASCLTISAEGLKIDRYWTLSLGQELKLSSDEEYAEALREVFIEAVRCRLRSAYPIGSHLSGGLDSSSVTCVARQLLKSQGSKQLHVFSNIFETATECDEREFIEAVVAQGDLIPHYVHADRTGPLSNLEDIFRYSDEPINGPTHFLLMGLQDSASKQGVRVVLDGFDGDNTISHGEVYLTELARNGKWAELANELSALHKLGFSSLDGLRKHGLVYLEELARQSKWQEFRRASDEILKHFRVSPREIWLRHGLKPLLPKLVLRAWSALHGNLSPSERKSIVRRSFAKKIGLKQRIAKQDIGLHLSQTQREHHLGCMNSGALTLTLEASDCYAAAFSLEARHPFMDKRLIEFCLSLPPEQKFNQGWSRLVIRRAMKGILPEAVQWRRGKSDMSTSFVSGLLVHNQKLLDEMMVKHLPRINGYVNTNQLHNIYHELLSLNNYQAPENLTDVSLWQTAMLAFWLCKSGF